MQSQQDPIELMTLRLQRISPSTQTVKVYRVSVKLFCKFLQLTPSELIEKIGSGEVQIEERLNEWLDYLAANGLTAATQRTYFFSIKKFVEINIPRRTFFWKIVQLPRLRAVEADRLPSKAELLRILAHANLTDKLMVCFLSSSGVREGTLSGLRVKDIDLDTYPDIAIVRVPSELNKARIPYITFLSPQARVLLEEYLEVRRSKGILDPDSRLILDNRLASGISGSALAKRWRHLLHRTRLAQKVRKYHFLRLHTLRKYFGTMLTAAGVSPSPRERMMGHTSGFREPTLALDSSYYRPEIEDLAKEYRKAIPQLTIEELRPDDIEIRKRTLLDMSKLLFDEKTSAEIEATLNGSRNLDESLKGITRILWVKGTFKEVMAKVERERKRKEAEKHRRS